METSLLIIYGRLFVLILVVLWAYFFVYSYKQKGGNPLGFVVVIVGLLVAGYEFTFSFTQAILVKIEPVFLVSLFAVFWNVNHVQLQLQTRSIKDFCRYLGVGLILGLLFGFFIRAAIGYSDLLLYAQLAPISIISAGIQTSIAEEVIHRGLFLKYLMMYGFKPVYAILFQSLVFTAIHIPSYANHWMGLWVVLLLGIVANYLAWKNNNLIPSIVMHLTANLLGIVVVLAVK